MLAWFFYDGAHTLLPLSERVFAEESLIDGYMGFVKRRFNRELDRKQTAKEVRLVLFTFERQGLFRLLIDSSGKLRVMSREPFLKDKVLRDGVMRFHRYQRKYQ